MSNTDVAVLGSGFSTSLPELNDTQLKQASAVFGSVFNGITSGMARLKVRKMDFLLSYGQDSEAIAANNMFAVLVGAADCNHAVWYHSKYTGIDDKGTAPDLVWKMPTENTFPDALPRQFREKVNRDGRTVWAFQVRRRTVWVRVVPEKHGVRFDWERPFIFDLTGQSLYGKSMPDDNLYKWTALCSMCMAKGITPGHFVTSIMHDMTIQNPGPVFFSPWRDNNKALLYLDAASMKKLLEVATSDHVKNMCDVKEKLTYGDEETAQPARPAASDDLPFDGNVTPSESSAIDDLLATLK